MQHLSQDLQIVKRRDVSKAARLEPSETLKSSLLSILPVETWQLVVDNFTPGTLHSFFLLCKQSAELFATKEKIYQWLEKNSQQVLDLALKRLETRLQALPRQLRTLIEVVLERKDAILAGGFVLQCLTNQTFEDSDVDLFVITDMAVDFRRVNDEVVQLLKRRLEFTSPESPYFGCNADRMEKYGHLENVRSIYSVTWPNAPSVQIILVKLNADIPIIEQTYKSLGDYVEQCFDLSFCKCWFDGQAVISQRVPDQVTRQGMMDYRTLERMENTIALQNNGALEDLRRVTKRRVSKYEERGFTVLKKKEIP